MVSSKAHSVSKDRKTYGLNPPPRGVYLQKETALAERGFLSGNGSSIGGTHQHKPYLVCPPGFSGTRRGLPTDHGDNLVCQSNPESSLLACLRVDRRNYLGPSRRLDGARHGKQRAVAIALDRCSRSYSLGGRNLH